MPLYRYDALSREGKKERGVIDADSLNSAKEKLKKNQVLVTKILPFRQKKREIWLPFSFLIDFTRTLEQLLTAGIPLYENLVILEERYRRHRFHPLLIDLCDALKRGVSLSESLKKYPKSFTPIYVAMVKAGEESGHLSIVFGQLCHLLHHQQRLKKQLFSAAAYPLFLGSFCVFVFFLLLIFVIPSMQPLFEGRDLHLITQLVFSMSNGVVAYLNTVVIAIVFTVVLCMIFLKHSSFRKKWDEVWLKLPWIGKWMVEAATIRFCRTASLLLLGGTPILEALKLARKVIHNHHLEEVMVRVEEQANEGKSLSAELKKYSLIPSLLPQMLSIAEKTGKIGFMLQSIATICEEGLEKELSKFTSLLQPILLLLLGLIVGIVLLSILIPLTDVGSILQT